MRLKLFNCKNLFSIYSFKYQKKVCLHFLHENKSEIILWRNFFNLSDDFVVIEQSMKDYKINISYRLIIRNSEISGGKKLCVFF